MCVNPKYCDENVSVDIVTLGQTEPNCHLHSTLSSFPCLVDDDLNNPQYTISRQNIFEAYSEDIFSGFGVNLKKNAKIEWMLGLDCFQLN